MIGELAAITSAICWATAAVMYKSAMDEKSVDPVSVNFVRLIPVSIFLFFLVWGMGKLWQIWYLSMTHLTYLILGSIMALGLGDSVYFLALKYAGVSRGVAISSTYPLFTAVIEIALRRERLDPFKLIGIVMIVSAIWILSGREGGEEGEEGEGGDVVRGVTFSVLTAIIWAIGIVLIDYALEGIDFYIANMIRFPVLAVVVGGVLLATGNHRNMLEMTRRQAVMLVLAGILALAIGGLTFFASITFVGAAEATALSSLSPIFSAVISVSSGKEAFSWRVTAGVILATSGTVILVLFG